MSFNNQRFNIINDRITEEASAANLIIDVLQGFSFLVHFIACCAVLGDKMHN